MPRPGAFAERRGLCVERVYLLVHFGSLRAPMGPHSPTILHVGSRDQIRGLRDTILRTSGYEVDSTASIDEALRLATAAKYSLVIIDVEGDGRVPAAEKLCSEIKRHHPDQAVVFICNYRVSVNSDCPNEIVRSEFNPQAMLDSVKAILDDKPADL
jgi:DNA-binding NtrC family response regulator